MTDSFDIKVRNVVLIVLVGLAYVIYRSCSPAKQEDLSPTPTPATEDTIQQNPRLGCTPVDMFLPEGVYRC